MKTAESLAALYTIINKLMGPVEAKKSLTAAMSLVISDLQEEGLSITPELIDERLKIYVNDFIEVDRKNGAAQGSMKSSEALAELYTIIAEEMGNVKAKQSVSNSIELVISDIQDAKLPVTAEEIEKRIIEYVTIYLEVAAKTNIA